MNLGHYRTPGVYDPRRTVQRLGIPGDLAGLTVLDVGSWDGFYAFEAERRGASRVVATDSFCWGGPGWGSKAGFEYAHSFLGSSVESVECEPYELHETADSGFDVVLFLGVLYHLKEPLPTLSSLRRVSMAMRKSSLVDR